MITLATLRQATEQEIFDQVVGHLLKQNAQCVEAICGVKNVNDSCVYWDKETGMKCAAGCLIAEDEYDWSLEKNDWQALATQGMVPLFHAEFIQKLQSIHDKNSDPTKWIKPFCDLAKERNLKFIPPNEVTSALR